MNRKKGLSNLTENLFFLRAFCEKNMQSIPPQKKKKRMTDFPLKSTDHFVCVYYSHNQLAIWYTVLEIPVDIWLGMFVFSFRFKRTFKPT